MPVDLYMQDPLEGNFKEGILEITDELRMLVDQIRMILFTKPGEVLGAPDFGVSLEEQLFTFNVNEYTLKSMLQDQVTKFVPMAERFQISFDVKFARGTVRDICLIDTKINGSPVFGVIVK